MSSSGGQGPQGNGIGCAVRGHRSTGYPGGLAGAWSQGLLPPRGQGHGHTPSGDSWGQSQALLAPQNWIEKPRLEQSRFPN